MHIQAINRSLNYWHKQNPFECKRFKDDCVDLNLTYITEDCELPPTKSLLPYLTNIFARAGIAMSAPAHGRDLPCTNPIEDLKYFLFKRHGRKFVIFNLCKERNYDKSTFEGMVLRIPIAHGSPPTLKQMLAFLEQAGHLIEKDPSYCLAVHSLQGKGRTGAMISAWLLYSKFRLTATDAMDWFEQSRIDRRDNDGPDDASPNVMQPSQRRYVRYIETILSSGGYFTPELLLRKIVIKTSPRMNSEGGCRPWFLIEENGATVFDYRTSVGQHRSTLKFPAGEEPMEFGVDLKVQGDIRILFFNHGEVRVSPILCGLGGLRRRQRDAASDTPRFAVGFHTGFVWSECYVLPKGEVDVACDDQESRVFDRSFAVECHFGSIPLESGLFSKVDGPSLEFLELVRAGKGQGNEALEDLRGA